MKLTDLIKKLSEDKEFEARYRELDDIEAVLHQASKDGYSITAEDVETLRCEAEYNESGRAELSDDMMEDVAGGTMAGLDAPPSWPQQWLRSLFNKKQGTSAVPLPYNKKESPKITTLPHTPTNTNNVTTLPAMLFPDEAPNAQADDIGIC